MIYGFSWQIKQNGTINERKNYEMETEMYGTIYKNNLTRMLRDRFGARIQKKEILKHAVYFLTLKKLKTI